jgi:hypothetical protein
MADSSIIWVAECSIFPTPKKVVELSTRRSQTAATDEIWWGDHAGKPPCAGEESDISD